MNEQKQEKYCSKCQATKPFSDFKNKKNSKDGKQCWCRSCEHINQKQYRHKKGINKRYKEDISVDVSGMKFEYIKVINRVTDIKGKTHLWNCICDCGRTKMVRSNHLINGKVTSCGCKMNRNGSECKLWDGYGEISGSYFSKIRSGALSREISFNITIEYIWNLFIKQNRKCALTGIDLDIGGHNNKINKTASLDRIDNNKGYEEGNVQWVHKDVNRMKREYLEEYFIEICKKITEHQNEKKLNGKI